MLLALDLEGLFDHLLHDLPVHHAHRDAARLPEPERLSELYLDELRCLAVAHRVDPDDTSEPPQRAAVGGAGTAPPSNPRELV